MGKTARMNRHQKAAHRPGEPRVSREEVTILLEMTCSDDAEERLTAARYLCPCHVRGYIQTVWDAIFRLMTDPDPRVRFAAWHTLEDGGVPDDAETRARLRSFLAQEADKKVRRFASSILADVLAEERAREHRRLQLAARSVYTEQGKCDFCGETDVSVRKELGTAIPTQGLPRAAYICAACESEISEG